jgi:glycosyltransferase involved in cell wall biosynthesis
MVTLLRSLEGRVNRVLALPVSGSLREVAEAEHLAEEYVDLPRKQGTRFDRLFRVAAGLKLAWWMMRRRSRVSAIHANALTGLNMSVPAALLHRGNIVVWIHDPVGSRWGNRLGPFVRRLVPGLKIAAVSRVAEGVAVENGLCQRGAAHLVPNPIDPADVVPAVPTPTAGPLSVGVLGGATHRKGFDLLPDTIEILHDNSVEWHLFVSSVVAPEMEATWRRLRAMENVHVHEKVFDVASAYGQLDIVFCPSRNESFCRVAAEAMINGIPVVGSDIEPLRDLLGEEEAGITFSNDDPTRAAAALRRLLDDPGLRTEMGNEGKRRSEAFGPAAIANRLLELYGL